MKGKLINGDCRNVLNRLIDDGVSADLVVTSPPYDNLRKYDDFEWDFEIFTDIAHKLYDILCDGGVCVWIVGDATFNGTETGTSFKQALWAMECGFKL